VPPRCGEEDVVVVVADAEYSMLDRCHKLVTSLVEVPGRLAAALI
jgi:hypothetical protein